MDLQFYPTPPELARRMWEKFKNKEFVRVLEPSAGEGHLAEGRPHDSYSGRSVPVDCIEMDVTKHPLLTEKGFDVVGVDFLHFDGAGSQYTHIVMNPPFSMGAQHVLKAWQILYHGEISALLNADTIRNPFSKERQMLVRLIEEHGEVEFIEGAFTVEEAERKTEVDVALVYLSKTAAFGAEMMGDILDGLKIDKSMDSLHEGFEQKHEVTIPASYIENAVINFKAAVETMRQSVFSEARADAYAARVGKSMEEMNKDAPTKDKDLDNLLQRVQREIHKRYKDLKNRAWTGVVRSTDVLSKLSSAAQKRLESEFETIKKLEFTESNIYGLLGGLIEKRGDMQLQMACDIFDEITRYHTDNTVFYKGWKSNDKHRAMGMRIKMTRFVLPNHKTESWQRSLSWDSMRLLADFDKVFAMLDSKLSPEVSLEWVFNNKLDELRAGNRISSSYFDVRYYGVGTIHFFPREKTLIDRLNKLVGRHRLWLPSEGERVNEAFWLQFDNAEKYDKEVRTEVNKLRRNAWDDPLRAVFWGADSRADEAKDKVATAIDTVLKKHGIDPDSLLEAPETNQTLALPLLAA